MSDQWGTREHVPDRHPPTNRRREWTPGTAAAQQAYLSLGAVALTMATVTCLFERLGAIEVGKGVYAILAGLFVIGAQGWTVCRAESRVRRELGAKVDELTAVLAELRDEVTRQRSAYLPPPRRHHDGQRYIGTVGITDPAGPTHPGLDQECIAAARRITDRLRVVDNP